MAIKTQYLIQPAEVFPVACLWVTGPFRLLPCYYTISSTNYWVTSFEVVDTILEEALSLHL